MHFLLLPLLVVAIAFLIQWFRLSSSPVPAKGDVLLVFAHPDDEAMFFSPLLVALYRQKIPVHFLCLSNGNAEGLGSIREKELYESGKFFGVSSRNIRIVNDPDLQDGMKTVWSTAAVRREVNQYLNQSGAIRTVITFDRYGVSKHPNHIAVHYGVKELRDSMPPGIFFSQLVTRYIGPKYSGVFSLFYYSMFFSSSKCTPTNFSVSIPPLSFHTSLRAMRKHQSQLRWFRYLFVVFSSYTYINELEVLQ